MILSEFVSRQIGQHYYDNCHLKELRFQGQQTGEDGLLSYWWDFNNLNAYQEMKVKANLDQAKFPICRNFKT